MFFPNVYPYSYAMHNDSTLITSTCLLLQGQVRMIGSLIIHRPRFHKVYMPGVNEGMCGFTRVSTLAPVSTVSESLIAVTL